MCDVATKMDDEIDKIISEEASLIYLQDYTGARLNGSRSTPSGRTPTSTATLQSCRAPTRAIMVGDLALKESTEEEGTSLGLSRSSRKIANDRSYWRLDLTRLES